MLHCGKLGKVDTSTCTSVKTALQINTALLNREHKGKLPEVVGRHRQILDLWRKSWPDLQIFEKLRLGFIYYKIYHLKVYSLVVFGIFTGFCNHHHFLVSRTFHHPKNLSPLAVTPSFFSHSTWQPLIYFCPCGFACSGHFLWMEWYSMGPFMTDCFTEHRRLVFGLYFFLLVIVTVLSSLARKALF